MMIKVEDYDKSERVFDKSRIIICAISIIVSLIVTYIVMNFVDFNGMLDDIKLKFMKENMATIAKYFSFVVGIMFIGLYSVLHFAFSKVVNYIYETRIEGRE